MIMFAARGPISYILAFVWWGQGKSRKKLPRETALKVRKREETDRKKTSRKEKDKISRQRQARGKKKNIKSKTVQQRRMFISSCST